MAQRVNRNRNTETNSKPTIVIRIKMQSLTAISATKSYRVRLLYPCQDDWPLDVLPSFFQSGYEWVYGAEIAFRRLQLSLSFLNRIFTQKTNVFIGWLFCQLEFHLSWWSLPYFLAYFFLENYNSEELNLWIGSIGECHRDFGFSVTVIFQIGKFGVCAKRLFGSGVHCGLRIFRFLASGFWFS